MNKHNFWEEITLNNYQQINNYENIALIVKDIDSDNSKHIINIFVNIAKEYSKTSTLKFYIVNSASFIELVYEAGVEVDEIPALIITHPIQKHSYIKANLADTITVAEMKQWIDAYKSKKLKPTPINTYSYDKDGVTTLYSHDTMLADQNWEKITFDTQKDVFVIFFQHRCLYCRAMAPHYKALAKIFSKTPNLIIASFNTQESLSPTYPSISKIPVLYFYPTNNKDKPIYFDEPDRTVKSLFKFVMKHQTTLTPTEIELVEQEYDVIKDTVIS